ncbi:MAG: hypothetical protein ACI84R_002629 [Candidatus Azotimanducaceae bacterium]
MRVHTSDIRKAGTKAKVFITLYGTRYPDGELSRTDLDISGETDFGRNQTSTYRATTLNDIGEITHVKMNHDNARPGSSWHLHTVEVRPIGASKWIKVTFDRWVATDEEDGLLETTKKQRDDYDAWKKALPGKNGTPVGTWSTPCSGGQNCSSQIETSMQFGSSEKNTFSKEVSESLSVTVTSISGNKLDGVENSVSVTGTVAGKHTKVREMLTSKTDGHSESCKYDIDMVNFNIAYIWQWNVETSYQGTAVKIGTCQVACTPNSYAPTFPPNDPRNIGSCLLPTTFSSVQDAGLPGHNIGDPLETVSLNTCMAACTANGSCKSFDYERGPGRCYLQSASASDAGVTLKRDYDGNPYDHYSLK